MTGKVKKLEAQLFIEGMQVPFVSISCHSKAGQASTATISLVPLGELRQIVPRTMVHVFVKDSSSPLGVKPWVLLYEGEIYGYGLTKNSSNRAFTIYCMDYSNYWDNAKQYYVNLKTSLGGGTKGLFQSRAKISNATKDQTQVITSQGSTQSYLASNMSNILKTGKSFIEAISSVLKGVKEVNSFFRYGSARYRIDDRILFKDSGKIKSLVDLANTNNLMDQITGRGNGGIVTLRSVINHLLNLVFHDFVSIMAPSKVDSPISGFKGIGKGGKQTIGSFIFKPNNYMTTPPKCNILFPDYYSRLEYSRNFFNEVTRLKIQPDLPGTTIGKTVTPVSARKTYYAPSGFHKFETGQDTSELKNTSSMFEGESQGTLGDDSKATTKTSTTLQDFNFLSYEEILKGIFPDLGGTVPAAQIFAKNLKTKNLETYFGRAADFLFFKKRYASRGFGTSGPFNMAPVPGFPIVLMDDSDAEMHIIGQLDEVTHTISSTQGGYTTYGIKFSRLLEEFDFWDQRPSEPPIPPWYDGAIFGSKRPVNEGDYKNLPKKDHQRIKNYGSLNDFGNTSIGDFYKGLLGDSISSSHNGATPVTSKKFPGILSAVLNLTKTYRAAKKANKVSDFISLQTRRDYVELEENFSFLGADNSKFKGKGKSSPTFYKSLKNLVFKGGSFDGNFVNNDTAKDENARDKKLKDLFGPTATTKRRSAIKAYKTRLAKTRGFRG